MIRLSFPVSWRKCILVTLFGLAIVPHLVKAQSETFRPSIIWSVDGFSKNVNKTLSIRLGSIQYFVCDNRFTYATPRWSSKNRDDMYVNLWKVDKADYEQCKVNKTKSTSKLLIQCNDPSGLRAYTAEFKELVSYKDKPVYKEDHFYYFISTANGTKSSLDSLEGGYCRSHNMRLAVYICDPYSPECSYKKPETTASPEPTTYFKTSNYTETANYTETGNYSEVTTYTTTVPTTHSHSIKQPFELVWNVRYNESQNLYIYKESDFPIVAFCEANSVITRLGDEGEVVNSWPCQSGVHHLVILKPKYNNGDVYVFEAFPEQGSVQVLKSTLTVNIASEGNLEYLVSDAIPSTGKPAFAFLISLYLLTASAW
ncbi:hypothetical protein [Endozoicomonas sp. 2B-B]